MYSRKVNKEKGERLSGKTELKFTMSPLNATAIRASPAYPKRRYYYG